MVSCTGGSHLKVLMIVTICKNIFPGKEREGIKMRIVIAFWLRHIEWKCKTDDARMVNRRKIPAVFRRLGRKYEENCPSVGISLFSLWYKKAKGSMPLWWKYKKQSIYHSCFPRSLPESEVLCHKRLHNKLASFVFSRGRFFGGKEEEVPVVFMLSSRREAFLN